jgi:hypothetical protein
MLQTNQLLQYRRHPLSHRLILFGGFLIRK